MNVTIRYYMPDTYAVVSVDGEEMYKNKLTSQQQWRKRNESKK